MSNKDIKHTSFEEDKKIFDNWRLFLNEGKQRLAEAETETVVPVPPGTLKKKELVPSGIPELPAGSTKVNPIGTGTSGESEEGFEAAATGRAEWEKELLDYYNRFKGNVPMDIDAILGRAGTKTAAEPLPAGQRPALDYEQIIDDLGGIMAGREGVASQPIKGKPGFINTVYRDKQGNPFLANTRDFKVDGTGSAPLPDPGTDAVDAAGNPIKIWTRDPLTNAQSLTKAGRGIVNRWLKNNPDYVNMLAKARVDTNRPWGVSAEKQPVTGPPPAKINEAKKAMARYNSESGLSRKEIIQEVYKRFIKLTEK